MEGQHYSTNITSNASAQQAFDCINQVSGWWTENVEGNSTALHDEFTVRFGDVHVSTQKLVEFVPGKRVAWQVTYSRLNFIEHKDEWTGTTICFDISEKDGQSEVTFTHIGLVPQVECYNACTNAWAPYIEQSLFRLLNTDQGQPTRKDPQAV